MDPVADFAGRHGVTTREIRELTALAHRKGQKLQAWIEASGHSAHRIAEDIWPPRVEWIRRQLEGLPDESEVRDGKLADGLA